ncbi:hypothetical protein NQD34_006689 [Periophthalmus magnuspinnatus]|nr:hypothetical protein NQD34_006689 [Periophthalmus magnuspinnatus]
MAPSISQDSQSPTWDLNQDLNQDLTRTKLNRRKVQRVRRVLFPFRTKRPDPKPEPDLVQRGLLLLWVLLCLQIYTEDTLTELQNQDPGMPAIEPQDGAPIVRTAQSGVGVEPCRVLTTTDTQLQCVVA